MFTRSETAPIEAPAVPDVELVEATETQLDPPTKVLLHNEFNIPCETQKVRPYLIRSTRIDYLHR